MLLWICPLFLKFLSSLELLHYWTQTLASVELYHEEPFQKDKWTLVQWATCAIAMATVSNIVFLSWLKSFKRVTGTNLNVTMYEGNWKEGVVLLYVLTKYSYSSSILFFYVIDLLFGAFRLKVSRLRQNKLFLVWHRCFCRASVCERC